MFKESLPTGAELGKNVLRLAFLRLAEASLKQKRLLSTNVSSTLPGLFGRNFLGDTLTLLRSLRVVPIHHYHCHRPLLPGMRIIALYLPGPKMTTRKNLMMEALSLKNIQALGMMSRYPLLRI